MNTDWQRLSPWAILPLVVTALVRFVRQGLPALAGLGAGALYGDLVDARLVAMVAGAVLLAVAAGGILAYRRFRFCIEPDAIRVRSGILVRREVRVAFERVRDLTTRQPLYLRPLGLVRLTVETAGAQGEEVSLPGIPGCLAESLREQVFRSGAAAGAAADSDTARAADAEATSAATIILHAPGTGRLFLFGLTSRLPLLILVFLLAYAAGGGGSDGIDPRVEGVARALTRRTGELTGFDLPAALVLLAAAGIAAVLLIAGIVAAGRFHGFRLLAETERLRTRHGLLERREQSLRRDRVQGITLDQAPLARAPRLWQLRAHPAVSATGSPGADAGSGPLTVPAVRDAELAALLGTFVPGVRELPRWRAIARAYVHWRTSRGAIAAVLAVGLLWALGALSALVALAIAVAAVVALRLLAEWRWRGFGWARSGDLLWVRRGVASRRVALFALDRVQQVRVDRSPYQRRHDLATLVLALPHGTERLPFLCWEDAVALANEVLYRVETARHHDL